jgi:hypothetical protein
MRPNDLLYYLMWNAIIPFGRWFLDIFIHSSVETLHGYKIHDYVQDCARRYAARKVRWKMNEVGGVGVRKTLQEPYRSLDQNCFSPQFFFAVSYHCSGIWMLTLGSTFVLNSSKSPLDDIACVAVAAMTAIIVSGVFQPQGVKLARKYWFNKFTPDKTKPDPIADVVTQIEKLEDMSTEDLRTIVAMAFNHHVQVETSDATKTVINESDPNAEIDTEKIVDLGFKASGSAKVGQTTLPDWPDELGDGAKWAMGDDEQALSLLTSVHVKVKAKITIEKNPRTGKMMLMFKGALYDVDWIGAPSPDCRSLTIQSIEEFVGGEVLLSNSFTFKNPKANGEDQNDFADFGVDPFTEGDVNGGEMVDFDFSDFNYDRILEDDEEHIDVGFDLVSEEDESEGEHGDWPEELGKSVFNICALSILNKHFYVQSTCTGRLTDF